MHKTPPFKTKSKNPSLVFAPTDEHYKAQVWCFQNGFKISLDLIDNGYGDYNKCRIKVKQGKNVSYGKKIYPNDHNKFTEPIWDLYLKLYNKQKIK